MDSSVVEPDSLALQIQEIGFSFCSSAIECKRCLNALGFRNVSPLAIAHVFAMMVRTHSGLKDGVPLAMPQMSLPEEKDERETWDVETFVKVLHEMVPTLDWSDVVLKLDHPGFMIHDKQGLALLSKGLLYGLRDRVFPIALLYKSWNNKDGQISWIKQILMHPDVFCITDYPHRSINYDVLKVPPDETDKSIIIWKSLDLIETLLCLSDASGLLFSFVDECFFDAKNECPDLLTLGLLQVSMSVFNQMRQELLSACLPIFFDSHPNSNIMLQYAWNCQVLGPTAMKSMILNGMADWYVRDPDDTVRLGHVLEIAHDLKALSDLLNVNQFAFVIDLACLASRREYLKLDKWINDKINEHQEPFVKACIQFIKRRFPPNLGGLAPAEQSKASQLPTETLRTILLCLQQVITYASASSCEEIIRILQKCRVFLTKPATTLIPKVPTPIVSSSGQQQQQSIGSMSQKQQNIIGSTRQQTPSGAGSALLSSSGQNKPTVSDLFSMSSTAGLGPTTKGFSSGTLGSFGVQGLSSGPSASSSVSEEELGSSSIHIKRMPFRIINQILYLTLKPPNSTESTRKECKDWNNAVNKLHNLTLLVNKNKDSKLISYRFSICENSFDIEELNNYNHPDTCNSIKTVRLSLDNFSFEDLIKILKSIDGKTSNNCELVLSLDNLIILDRDVNTILRHSAKTSLYREFKSFQLKSLDISFSEGVQCHDSILQYLIFN